MPSTAVTAGEEYPRNIWKRRFGNRPALPEAAVEYTVMTGEQEPSASAVQGAALAEVAVASDTAGGAGAAVTAGDAAYQDHAPTESAWSEVCFGVGSPLCHPGLSDVTGGPDLNDVNSVAGDVVDDSGYGGVPPDSHFAPWNGPDGSRVPLPDLQSCLDFGRFSSVADMSAQFISAIKRDVDSARGVGQVRSSPYFMAHICRCVK